MNFEQIITTYYASQFSQGLFGLAYSGEDIVISFWNVPDVPQPSHEEVMALDTPELEHMYQFYRFIDAGTPLIAAYVDAVAREKNYDTAVSCASYVSSTIPAWQAQAVAFVAWRDSVYSYCIAQETLMQTGARSIPTFEEFKTELPVMVWPS